MGVVITFKASPELRRRLDEIARELGVSKSFLIKKAIVRYILEGDPRQLMNPPTRIGYKRVVVY